jgi:DNA ligase 1
MRAFSELYEELDTTTSTNLKVAAMVRYFKAAPAGDAAWAAYILSGNRLKRFIGPALLYRWLLEASGLPEWLVEESRATVGDLAETIALLTESTPGDSAQRLAPDVSLSAWIEERLLPLRAADEPHQRATIVNWWRTLPYRTSFLVNKFLTGELRVGVSELLVTRALAEVLSIARPDVARRLMGDWMPSAEFWETLRSGEAPPEDASAPYPFFLASPLEADPATLGSRELWQAEWKWDGIRSQLIRRQGQCFIWSRGEDLVTDRFPEVFAAAARLPDGVVLDGELVAWRDGVIRPFADLQQRIGRRKLTPAILKSVPVRFLAYDLLEQDCADLRALALRERRARLEALVASAPEAIDARGHPGVLGGVGQGARGVPRTQRRRIDVEVAGIAVWHRSAAGCLVEMENRPLLFRGRHALCAARPRSPLQSVHRLHLWCLEQRRARSGREGLFGPQQCADRGIG